MADSRRDHTERHRVPYKAAPFEPGIPTWPTTPSEPVRVLVEDVGAGVWARVTGHKDDGTPVTVTGAIIAGPDSDGEVAAVQVRDYDGNPDEVVYVPADGHVELLYDPAKRRAMRAAAIAPVYAPGAARVCLYRRVPSAVEGGKDDWVEETHTDVTAEQLERWERGCGGAVLLSSVHRHHAPIPAGRR